MVTIIGAPYIPENGEKWQYIETVSGSAVSSLTSNTLDAYDEYLLVIHTTVITTGGENILRLGSGGTLDTGTNYSARYLNATSWTSVTSQTGILAIQNGTGVSGDRNYTVICRIAGTSPAVATGILGVGIKVCGNPTTAGVQGEWLAGNDKQVNIISYLNNSTGTFTGSMEIYGRFNR